MITIQKEEIDDYDWFSYDDAVKLELAFDYKKIIEKLRKEELI